MKIYSLFLISALILFISYQTGSADRLHHWVDSKGITHLSKEPPPQDGKLVEIMEYSVRTEKPAKTDQVVSGKKSAEQSGDVMVEKSQETEERPKPKGDPAAVCYFHAKTEDVYVYVIEYADSDSVVEKVLYQGTIPKGQKQLIESSRGKIEFSYRLSSEDRTYGDNRADCANGKVISSP
jgi:hypothetical protein